MTFFSKSIFLNYTLFIALALTGSSCSQDEAHDKSKHKHSRLSAKEVELKDNMRKLWTDHVLWTRNVVFCLVDELPGTDQAIKRLQQNQEDIGNAFKPYYEEVAVKKLKTLLHLHISISAEVVNAAKTENATNYEEANTRWHKNSDDISELLNMMNAKWDLVEMKKMMSYHLDLTTDEAIHRIKKNYDADVVSFDKINDEILKMADMFSDGIATQFPEKFETCSSKQN